MNFDKEHLELTAKVVGTVSGIYGLYAIFNKSIIKLINFIKYPFKDGAKASQDLTEHFGENPGKALKFLASRLTEENGKLKLRLDIHEEYLEIGIYICDPHGKCIWANKNLADLFGVNTEDMRGYGWLASIENKEDALKRWVFSVNNKIPYRDSYIVENQRTKEKIYCMTRAEPSIVEDVLLGYVGFVKKQVEHSITVKNNDTFY